MNDTANPSSPESWGAASAGYAEKVAPLMMETFADEFVNRLGVDAQCEALEVAAGSGALTARLARQAKSLLATDFAPKMIEVLRQRMTGHENVSFEVMDGQALDLDNDSFDRAACSFALMLFADRAKGFSELHRVLRPGGRAMVSGWADAEKFEAFGLFLGAMKAAFPDMPPPATPSPVFSLADLSNFKSQMEAAGFRDVEVEYVSRELEVPGFEAMWDMMTVGAPPVQVLFDKVGPEGKQRVRDNLQAIVDKRFGSGPIRVRNTATLGVGSVA